MTGGAARIAGIAFGLGIATFAAYQQFKLPVVLPVMLDSYDYDRTLAGGFMSIYALAGLALSVWASRLIERQGAFGPVLLALGLGILGNVVTLGAPESATVVLVGRALEGAAFAILAVCGPVLASSNASASQLPFVFGLIATWIPIGQLSATLLAPVSLATVGWQGLWWLAVVVGVLVALAALGLERHDPSLLFPARRGGGGLRSAPLTAGERVSLVVSGAVFMLWSGQYFAFMTWMPLYLVEVHGLDLRGAQIGYVVPVVLVASFSVINGILMRAGIRLGTLLVSAMVTQALVWWLIPHVDAGMLGIALVVVYGAGAGIVPSSLFGTPSAILGPGRNPAPGFGYIMTARNLGVLIGPVLIAEVSKAGGWNASAPVFATITTVCLGLALLLAARLRTH
ncbi:MAG: MFS transporter [Ectothiorhodospiraceae bacterium]|nr:MFS transporter [Ectothiorhodospiraceae bacterium]